MISQATNYSDARQADYSTVQREVAQKGRQQNQDFDIAEDRVSLSSKNDYGSVGNQNLSSVLSQIKDDGPAYVDSKHDDPENLTANNNNNYSTKQQAGTTTQANVQSDMAAELLQKINADSDTVVTEPKYIAWLQWSLFIFVISVTVFYLFRLDERTNQLEASLNIHQENIQNSIASHSDELTPGIASINEALHAVKNELELIKTKKIMPVSRSDSLTTEESLPLKETESEQVSILKDEILSLKNELKTANNKLIVINNNLPKETNLAESTASGKGVAGTITTDRRWMVNLASFTTKKSAEKIVKQLVSSGFSPLIEEAMVDGSRVYRLIVDDFKSRSEAELFIGTAAERFGLKGGWIRKS